MSNYHYQRGLLLPLMIFSSWTPGFSISVKAIVFQFTEYVGMVVKGTVFFMAKNSSCVYLCYRAFDIHIHICKCVCVHECVHLCVRVSHPHRGTSLTAARVPCTPGRPNVSHFTKTSLAPMIDSPLLRIKATR